MQKSPCLILASASILLLLSPSTRAATYADSVIAYSPGTGFATDFGSGQGLTNAAAALGAPSRSTPGKFGGPVDPFNPPYLKEQVVSIGTGGSLTLGFNSAIVDAAAHPFGVDFIVFGNAGFVITNGNYSGGGITDGSLFGASLPGATRVSVSADNVTYFQLDPARAPAVDGPFPTDGAGSFDLPVNPALTASAFAGLGLPAISALYQGAAGGAGFDLAWAQDASGHSVVVPEVRFIRIDVLNGAAEVDGIAVPATVPEPAAWALFGLGLVGLGCFRVRGRRAVLVA